MDLLDIRKQNPWWENPNRIQSDPRIKDFLAAQVQWTPRLRKYIYLDKNAVYSIRGPRQVGKTTLIKLMIRGLLEKGNPLSVMYFACDLLKDNLELNDLLSTYYTWIRTQTQERVHMFLDEISSVKDWQKTIKFFVDAQGNANLTLVITGSHTLDIKASTERLPGRVGEKEHVSTHKILLPMKFAEYVQTRNPELHKHIQALGLDNAPQRNAQFAELVTGNLPQSAQNLLRLLPELDALLDEYLITGGIMIAVNEYVQYQRIHAQIYDIYIRQIMGDMTRINREEKTARLILASLLKRVSTPISWNSLRTENAISSPNTVEQYATLLQQMFVLNPFYKIEMDGTIKRASNKKIHILNPFIFHALRGWLLNPAQDPYQSSIEFLSSSENKSKLVEAVVGDHLNRAAHNIRPTDTFDASEYVFYLMTKKGQEVDFIFKADTIFAGVEVKYQNELRAEDFRGLMKVGKGCLVSKKEFLQKNRIAVIPISIFLLYV